MTKPSSVPISEQKLSAPPPHRMRSLLVLIFRVLLLGIGGLTAGLLGVIVAQFYPAPPQPIEQPPLLENILRQSDALRKVVRRSPSTAAPDGQSDAPSTPLLSTSPVALLPLNPAQRQQLLTELTALQTQLTALGDRTTTLEVKVGGDRLPAPIETRLQTLEQQLRPPTSVAPITSPPPAPASPPPTSSKDERNHFMVTLPSDALFAADQTSLRLDSQALLSSVVNELQRYPGATIRVAAYTDAHDRAAETRSRSFAQAQAVEQYLSRALGEQYHWVTLGYGQGDPLATNDTPADRQRNRRVEIGIDPH
jgi:outer membrane protein OmpA-like peptidoglycan-associated protein